MKTQGRYRWEAELSDGTIITTKGDLSGAVRFSLIPSEKTGLPRHDLIGVPMRRRFARSFQKVAIGQNIFCKLLWESGSCWVRTPDDLRKELSPGDMIRKNKIAKPEPWSMVVAVEAEQVQLARPYNGKTAQFNTVKKNRTINTEYVHCIVCDNFRIWIRSSDGAVLITPQDYELWL